MTENTTTAARAASQPEALRLAAVLENYITGIGRIDATAAAAELRRLHALSAAPAAQEAEPTGCRISDPDGETPTKTALEIADDLMAEATMAANRANVSSDDYDISTTVRIAATILRRQYARIAGYRAMLAAAPQAPAAATAAALEQAWRAGWAACRDAEYVGEEAEDWAWGASATNGLAIDIEQSAPAAAVAPFQERVQPWMMACFGAEISADREERNHRFLEEALELVQSCGCSASEAHQLVDYVFGRPVGEPAQEVGGVMVTLAALCLANGLDMHAAGETELARIWTKIEAIRAKQAAKPKHSPLPEHAPTRAAASSQGAPIVWAKARDVGRIGDMSPSASLRVGLDSDNDVFVSVWDEDGGGSVEFCNGGGGGGRSMHTRLALIALMVAMEQDNAERPGLDWWALRMGGSKQEGGGA